MTAYQFNIVWEMQLTVDDAIDEDEAWTIAYSKIPDLFNKNRGSLMVDLVNDDYQDQWGLFDTDPEDEDITVISLNDGEYL